MSFPSDPINVESRNPKLASMAIVGHTSTSTSRIWVRLYRPGTWWLVMTTRPLDGDLDTLDGKQVDAFATGAVYCRPAVIGQVTDNTHTFKLRGLQPGTRVFNATSSAISRKPAPELAEHLIKKTGRIAGYDEGYANRLYALSGAQNFLMVTSDYSRGELSLALDLFRPAGDDGEVTKKKVTLL